MAEEKGVVAAVALSVNSSLGGQSGKARAAQIEEAVQQAILDATERDGLNVDTDAAEVRERMMAARQSVIDRWAQEETEQSRKGERHQ